MTEVVLIDTDSLLGLVYSNIGQSYIESANRLRVTKGVKEEIEGLIQDSSTEKAAKKAKSCLKKNSSIDYTNPLTQSRTHYHSGQNTKGEQTIHDYIIYGSHEVEVVLFFDSDMQDIMGRLDYPPPRFDIVTSVFNYLSPQISRTQMLLEAAKVSSGCDWMSERNLRDLFVESGILTRKEYEYRKVRELCKKVNIDL